MTRRLQLSALFVFFAAAIANADTCPILEGTFRCRANPEFDLSVQQYDDGGLSAYVLTDPSGQHRILTDGQFHPFTFANGQGQYRGDCEASRVTVDFRDPQGHAFTDIYYIERAALVRIRYAGGKATSLSCAPTRGTWRLYGH